MFGLSGHGVGVFSSTERDIHAALFGLVHSSWFWLSSYNCGFYVPILAPIICLLNPGDMLLIVNVPIRKEMRKCIDSL